MHEDLQIIVYPDPRLRKAAAPVEAFDASLKELAGRMLELMRQHEGVGLAAPQVGLPLRLFVMNHTKELKNDRVFVNPQLSEAEGSEEAEEGCHRRLLLPSRSWRSDDKRFHHEATTPPGHEAIFVHRESPVQARCVGTRENRVVPFVALRLI